MTYIDTIEKTLGCELSKRNLADVRFEHKEIFKLREAVGAYYKNNDLPPKKINEVRPFLSPHYPVGNKVQWPVRNHFNDNYRFEFERPASSPLVDLCKKYLLYSHSICFEDPLVYLLDYFEEKETEHSKARLPAIQFVLEDYAEMRELIQQGIVVLYCQDRVGAIYDNDFILSGLEISEICNKIGVTEVEASLISHPILKDIHLIDLLNNRIDLYFPTKVHSDVYAGLLHLFQKNFSSSDVKLPFMNSIIGEIDTLNLNRISTSDLISIRKNEETFEIWRNFNSEILDELYDDSMMYSNKSQEFLSVAKQKFKDVDPLIKGRLHSSDVLSDLKTATRTAGIGVSLGLLGGSVFQSSAAIPAFVGGMAPYAQLIWKYCLEGLPTKENLSINNHFMVYNLK